MANKKDVQICTSPYLLSILAGCESGGWHPLVEDFILVARKLEQLGFIYNKGNVIVMDQYEEGAGDV